MVSTEWSQTTKRLVVVGLVIVLLLVFYVFRALLPPIAIALVLAYILKPLADFVERRGKLPRTLAVILVFLALLTEHEAAAVHPRAGSDAGRVAWFDLAAPPPLAFDHAAILAHAVRQLQAGP